MHVIPIVTDALLLTETLDPNSTGKIRGGGGPYETIVVTAAKIQQAKMVHPR